MISVVMPSYNRAAYLPEAIESIRRQTYKDWELIIVDDGSTDSSEFVYKYYKNLDKRIKIVRIPNSGISAPRNTGIAHANGEYIAVMDSDDISSPDRLEKELKAIKDKDFVYSSYFQGDSAGNIQGIFYAPRKVLFENIKENNSYPHVTIMAHKWCFDQEPYRDDFRVNDDAWLVYRWFKAGFKSKCIDEPLVIVRYHAGNVSKERAAEIAKTQEIMNHEYES